MHSSWIKWYVEYNGNLSLRTSKVYLAVGFVNFSNKCLERLDCVLWWRVRVGLTELAALLSRENLNMGD